MKADTFASVRIEGSILPADLLARVAGSDSKLEGLRTEDYEPGEDRKLNELCNAAWARLSAVWEGFRKHVNPDDKLTLEKWHVPFFRVLGYGVLQKAPAFVIDEKPYPISHLYHHSPIHLVGAKHDLDKRIERSSPHGLLQEFLNRSEAHLWGFASNGNRLRILRDNIRLTRQAYVEFDLAAIFDGKLYSDFTLLWRLCHESRVRAEKPADCWLEKWSKLAAEQGKAALDRLRYGVEAAIKELGRGYLACPQNTELRRILKEGEFSPANYYRELLRVVYRLLFLFVAEDRELLLYPDEPADAKDRYRRWYSTQRLRRIAERVRGTPHTDLLESLALVMEKLGGTGEPALALPALGAPLRSGSHAAAHAVPHRQRGPPGRRPPSVPDRRRLRPPDRGLPQSRSRGTRQRLRIAAGTPPDLRPRLGRIRSRERRRERAENDGLVLHADFAHHVLARFGARSGAGGGCEGEGRGEGHSRSPHLRPGVRQRALPHRGGESRGEEARCRPHARSRTRPQSRADRPARCRRPLHLRRGHQPHGRGTLPGRALDGIARTGPAALLP